MASFDYSAVGPASSISVRVMLLSLWMPLLVLVAAVVWFAGWLGGTGPSVGLPYYLLSITPALALGWLLAIPLTMSVFLLHRRSHIVAYVCGAALVPLSFVAYVVGGLFLGPVGILIAVALSLPAWDVLLVVRRRQHCALSHK